MISHLMCIIVCLVVGSVVGLLVPGQNGTRMGTTLAEKTISSQPRKYFSPAPLITNLKDPSQRWIRLDVAYTFEPEETDLEVQRIGEEMLQDTLVFLRTLTVGMLEGSLGLIYLREELVDRASIRSRGKAKDVIIRSMVIQ